MTPCWSEVGSEREFTPARSAALMNPRKLNVHSSASSGAPGGIVIPPGSPGACDADGARPTPRAVRSPGRYESRGAGADVCSCASAALEPATSAAAINVAGHLRAARYEDKQSIVFLYAGPRANWYCGRR